MRVPRWKRRDARQDGLAAAVGLGAAAREPVPVGTEGRCPVCEAAARVDMVDTTTQRGYWSCVRCGKVWETHPTRVRTPEAR